MLVALAAVVAATVSAGGPWSAGWGFAAHGGVPPLPPNLQSFALNRSVVGYFVANNTGLASPEEASAEVTLGIVGIGWNLYHSSTSKTGGLEQYEIEQAAALKKARPDVGVMVLRNTEVVSTFWSSFREAMNDTQLWLQAPPGSGKPIDEPWGTDDPKSGGPTPKYFLNFSNPKTQAWWLEKYIGPALDQPNIDGVYTDCSCGTARGERFTPEEAAGRQTAFDSALALAKSKGKWLSAWAGPALVHGPGAPKGRCVETMKSLIALGANASMGMQLAAGLVKAPALGPQHPSSDPAQCGLRLHVDLSQCLKRATWSSYTLGGDRKSWTEHAGLACWQGHGADSVPNTSDYATTSLDECKQRCEARDNCTAIEFGSHATQSPSNVVSKVTVATFLLARGASAVITLPAYDRPMLSRPFSLEAGLNLNADPGTPLGPATLDGSVFTRKWSRADVSLDCDTLTPTITFK